MIAKNVYRIFVKKFSKRIINSIYLGILGREADSESLKSYQKTLAAKCNLAEIAGELASSEEGWDYRVRQNHQQVTTAVFHALLGRAPDAEAKEAYRLHFESGGSLQAFIAEVGSSAEHKALLLGQQSQDISGEDRKRVQYVDLIYQTYQALLGRDPEPEMVDSNLNRLMETGDCVGFIKDVGSSREHKVRLLFDK